ncbi:MAG: hypothetical protein NC338_06880 [Firmicutes bacterium]|nr:hypothetical protein [Bacillota bacterium]MCM1402012.1 hypothetical protein [Bacteroides sp.]MCM1477930.1 hypothetical protein [Bacteroides sp.]
MEEKKKKCCATKKTTVSADAIDEYPGVAVNKADDGKVDKKLVKERTCTLNNNPRTDE